MMEVKTTAFAIFLIILFAWRRRALNKLQNNEDKSDLRLLYERALKPHIDFYRTLPERIRRYRAKK